MTEITMTIAEALAQINEDAAKNVSHQHDESRSHFEKAPARHINKIALNEYVRQGDLYITAVESSHPHGREIQNRQLADGNTMGSRHIVESSECHIYTGTTQSNRWINLGPNDKVLLAPFIKSDKEIHISHPQHSDFHLPAGCYQVTVQMDAATKQRVAD